MKMKQELFPPLYCLDLMLQGVVAQVQNLLIMAEDVSLPPLIGSSRKWLLNLLWLNKGFHFLWILKEHPETSFCHFVEELLLFSFATRFQSLHHHHP